MHFHRRALPLLLSLGFLLSSCNEEIPGELVFHSDGGTFFYRTPSDPTPRPLQEGDYASKDGESVTFRGIATRPLPDAVRYLSASKEGYTFLGWRQKIASGYAESIQDFSTTAKWNYTRAEYGAYFEKNVALTFQPVIQRRVEDGAGNLVDEWVNFEAIPVETIESYANAKLASATVQGVIDQMNALLPSVDLSDGFDYLRYGKFSKVVSSPGASQLVNTITVDEQQTTFYVPYEANPSLTYVYPEGSFEFEGGPLISDSLPALSETKYVHGDADSFSDPLLRPTFPTPFLPGHRFSGWALEDGSFIDFDGYGAGSGLVVDSHAVTATFQKALPVAFDYDANLWEYAAPSDLSVYAGDVFDLSLLGADPASKSEGLSFDFWYYDADQNGSYEYGTDVSFRPEFPQKVPAGIEVLTLSVQAVENPALILSMSPEEAAFWDVEGLAQRGFKAQGDGSFLLRGKPGDLLSSLLPIEALKALVKDPSRYALEGFALPGGSPLPSALERPGLTVVPRARRREKVVLYHAVSAEPLAYSQTPVEAYWDVGFSSTFAGVDYADYEALLKDSLSSPLDGILPNPVLGGDQTFQGYVQSGWATDPGGGNPSSSFQVEAQPYESPAVLTLWALLKKRVQVKLVFQGASGVSREATLTGLEGESLPVATVNNLFEDVAPKGVLVRDEAGNPATLFPSANASFSASAME